MSPSSSQLRASQISFWKSLFLSKLKQLISTFSTIIFKIIPFSTLLQLLEIPYCDIVSYERKTKPTQLFWRYLAQSHLGEESLQCYICHKLTERSSQILTELKGTQQPQQLSSHLSATSKINLNSLWWNVTICLANNST